MESDEKFCMGGTERGRDRRGESDNFAVELACKCLYMLDTHNVMAVFIYPIKL